MTPKHDDTNGGSNRPERSVLKGALGRASGGTFEEIPPTQNHNSGLLAMHLVMASMRSSTTANNPLDRWEYDPISATMRCSTVPPDAPAACGGEARRSLPCTPTSLRARCHLGFFALETGLRARGEEW